MKRFAIATGIALATLALSGSAHSSVVPAHTVSGSYSGTGTLESTGECVFHTTASTTGNISPFGASTSVAFEFCPIGLTEPRPATGTFLFTGSAGTVGGTLSGTVEGTTPTLGLGFPYHFDLIVTSATGEFAGATGTMALDGFIGAGASTVNGDASGTLYYGTPIATARQDCADSGWRTLTDADGQPFRNIGQCMAFVSRFTP